MEKSVRRSRRWPRRILAVVILGMALALLTIVGIEGAARCLPYPAEQRALPPPARTALDRHGAVLAEIASVRGEWRRPLEPAAVHLRLTQAVVAVEDRRFRAHAGVDWQGVAAAVVSNLTPIGLRRGGSTITMQVERLRAAQADAARPRTLWTKLVESVRARQIERESSKDAILHEWLERAPFGANLVGAGAASRHWFGVDCRDLSLAQAALLAGLPQNPERLRPDRHPGRALARRDLVLALMRQQGCIDAATCAAAQAEPLGLRIPVPSWVVITLDPIPAGLAEMRTTRDAAMQVAAEAALERACSAPGVVRLAGALVVVDWTSGELRAAASVGAGWNDLSRSKRSPGSALKPFIYAAAFADGLCQPGSLLDDAALGWSGWKPMNIDHAWRGRMTAAEALAASRNLPALDLLRRTGVGRCGEYLESSGIPGAGAAAERAGLALAVGGIEVSPRDLARAYSHLARSAAFANANTDAQGRDGVAARGVLAALAVADRTAAIDPAAAKAGIAWKTGTSSGQRDAWCAAVGGRLAAVLWLGTVSGPGAPTLSGLDATAPECLALLAGLDPGPAIWQQEIRVADPLPPAPVRLAITSPAAGAEILGEVEGGPARIRLTCTGAQGRVWWFAGEQCLGPGDDTGSRWWQPAPGRHQVRAVDAGGRSAAVVIRAQ